MDQPLTVQRESYRPAVQALNLGASLLHALGLPVARLDEASLLASARRSTGLSDWGGEHFLAPMKQLIANLERRGITPLGRISARGVALKHLTNRLCLQAYLQDRPEVAARSIERPIFILGFPRTGTTLVQDLLSQAPQARALQFWELATPVPVHADPERDRQLREQDVGFKLNVTYRVAPELERVHETRTDTLEECWPLLANSFSTANWEMSMGLTEYGAWLDTQDLVPAYRDYRRALQVLTARKPGRLVLKCPDHLSHIDALIKVFPDAQFVWTHRDPVDCIASYCSMVSIGWRVLFGGFDPLEIGPVVQGGFHRWVSRAMAVRDRIGEERFIDVDFDSLVASPAQTVSAVAARCGLPGRDVDSVREDLERDRSDERGKHVYSVPRYGLSRADVHTQFAAYIERFGLNKSESVEAR